MKKIQARSIATNKVYEDWDALVAEEANGYQVIVVITRKSDGKVLGANTTEGGMTKAQARNRANKMRRKSKEHSQYRGMEYNFFVRPNWKAL